MKNSKKIYITSSLVVVLVTALLCVSYAVFTNVQEAKGKLNIVVGDLNYNIESGELNNGEIKVLSNTTKTLEIKITSLNSIDSIYELYYLVNDSKEVPTGLKIGYISSSLLPSEEMIIKNESKTVTIIIENKTDSDQTINFLIQGGLIGRELVLTNGISIPAYEDLYKENMLNGATPILTNNMIPIIWNDTNWVKADLKKQWYSYENYEWANMVLVTEESRSKYQNATANTIVESDDILTHYVWIPRYKYKLFNIEKQNAEIQLIDIEFENNNTVKSLGTTNETFLTHPAFSFGDTEVNGFWMMKYEMTGTTTNPTSKPNMRSLNNQKIKIFNDTIKSITNNSKYGLSSLDNSHMTTNYEWGAVAYLTQSKYGKYNNKQEEVYINNVKYQNLGAITGCSAETKDATEIKVTTPNCPIGYSYETEKGVKASTTGNITGIYDMSGGSYEYTMSVMYNSTENKNLSNADSGYTKEELDNIEEKYINKYSFGETSTDHSRGLIGDATREILSTFGVYNGGWFGDYSTMPTNTQPWVSRGGHMADSKLAGIFAFSLSGGGADTHVSSRGVITSE